MRLFFLYYHSELDLKCSAVLKLDKYLLDLNIFCTMLAQLIFVFIEFAHCLQVNIVQYVHVFPIKYRNHLINQLIEEIIDRSPHVILF